MATAPTNITAPPAAPAPTAAHGPITIPRVAIAFCTQCKWNLRAAYYAQELLQTFGTTLGEVALQPATGGTFVVTLFHHQRPSRRIGSGDDQQQEDVKEGDQDGQEVLEVQRTVVWDRKVDGGFPETKVLKGRIRDLVEPGRGLGHTDRALRKGRGEDDDKAEEKEKSTGDVEVKAVAREPGLDERRDGAGVSDGRDAEGNAEVNVEGRAKDCEDCR